MNKKYILWGLLIISLLYLGSIGGRPLFVEDETRYAEIAREMIANNNFVSPTLNNLDYFEKPIMGHWLNAAAIIVFGETPFAARFFPALCTILSGILVFFFGIKFFADKRVGPIAAMIFYTTPLVFAVGTYSVLDAQFSFFAVLTSFSYFIALESPKRKKFWGFLLIAGIALGCAFMIKGFVAAVIAGLPVAGFLLAKRRWKDFFLTPVAVVLIAGLISLPWAIAVHKTSPDFWNYFFWVEHIQRFTGNARSQHPEGFWYFLWVMPVVALPWTLLIWPVSLGLKMNFRKLFADSAMLFLFMCVILPFIFLSLCSGKLATYILPCFPALSLLWSVGLIEYYKKFQLSQIKKALHKLTYLLMFILILFIIYQAVSFLRLLPENLRIYQANEKVQYYVMMLSLISLLALLKRSLKAYSLTQMITLIAGALMVVMMTIHFIMPKRFTAKYAIEEFFLPKLDAVTPETKVVAFKKLIGGSCWMLKRSDIYVYDDPGELSYGIAQNSGKGRSLSLEEFTEITANKENHVVIMLDSERRAKKLPHSSIYSSKDGLYFLEYNRP